MGSGWVPGVPGGVPAFTDTRLNELLASIIQFNLLFKVLNETLQMNKIAECD